MSGAIQDTTEKPVIPGPDQELVGDDTQPSGDRTAEIESLSVDDVHGLLQNPRRRFIVASVLATGETDIGHLAREMAGWENDKDPAAVSSSERKRSYISLYQNHLPKLDESDVVEFDPDRGDVTPGPNVDLLERYMQVGADESQGVDRELGVVGGGLLVYLASAAVLGPVGSLQVALLLATLCTVGIVVASDLEEVPTISTLIRRARTRFADRPE